MKKKITALLMAVLLLLLSTVSPYDLKAASLEAELNMRSTIVKGSGESVECTVSGITDPVYTWVSDDTDVAEVVGYGKTAFVKYKSEGTATITVTATGAEGTATDSSTVTVTGDMPYHWDEEIPGEQWTYYELVDAPQNGKNYLIVTGNAAGSYAAVSSAMNKEKFNQSTVTVNTATDSSDNKLFIQTPASTCIWICTAENGNLSFANGGAYLSAKKDNQFQLATSVSTSAQWTYSGGKIKNVYYSGSYFHNNGGTAELSNKADKASNYFFYEETYHEIIAEIIPHDEIIPAPYEPSATLNYGNTDVDGERYDLYNTALGTEIKLDGSYTGFADKGDLVSAAWASSNTDVATVQNGIVTVTGSGLTEITYTVTDGTSSVVKKVLLNISQKGRPTETFVLATALEAGKQYAIVSTNDPASNAAAMTLDVLRFETAYNSIVRGGEAVTLEGSGSDVSFLSNNEKIIYTAETDADGYIYLKDYYGNYLTVDEVVGTANQLNITALADRTVASAFEYTGAGQLNATCHSEGRYEPQDAWGVKLGYYDGGSDANFYPIWSTDSTDNHKVYIYEKVETNPFVKIKYNGTSVGGTSMTIYEINEYSALNLAGEYWNFPENVIVSWDSSDENIASVDSNGFVQFTGEEGDVVISYTVTDADDSTVKAKSSISFITTYQKDPKRVFKPVTSMEAGKSYLIASSRSIGSVHTMYYQEKDSVALAPEYHVVQMDNTDASLFIETDEGDLSSVWTAEAAAASGYVYLKNEETGEYLYVTNNASNNGILTTGALNTGKVNMYSWQIREGLGLYSASGVFVYYSEGSTYFRPNYTSQSESNVYVFGETELTPVVKIRLDYVAIDGKTIEREEVCTYQTENLAAATSNFNTRKLNVVWTADNPEVATIDPSTGVLTYTGVSGTVNVTVTAVSTIPDENGEYDRATATATIDVVGTGGGEVSGKTYMLTDEFVAGEKYAFSIQNTAGNYMVMNCWAESFNNGAESILWSYNCDFVKNSTTTYFSSDERSICWTCEDAGNGKFYFKSDYGEYLVLFSHNGKKGLDVTATIGGRGTGSRIDFNNLRNAYLFNQYDSANHRVTTVQSGGNALSYFTSGLFRASSDPGKIYIYRQCDPSETVRPVANIRQSSFGGNTVISNSLLTRNEVSDGMTERLLSFYEGFDEIESVTWTSSDPLIATIDENGLITYTGREGVVTFTLTVDGYRDDIPVSIKDMVSMVVSPEPYEAPSDDYPDFPHEGSVRINKTANSQVGGTDFQSSGVAGVELAVTGVPMTKPVDVVIVFDHSSSMNYGGRLTRAIDDTRDFALQIVNKNEKNRVAIVTFDRMINDYPTYDNTNPSYSSYIHSNENRIITGDGTAAGAFMTLENADELAVQIDSLIYNDAADTNYDFGLEQAYKIVQAAKSDPRANESQYVIFMSDGEPYVYNRLCINYEQAVYTAWLTGDESNTTIKAMLADKAKYPVANYYHPDGDHWIAEAIKAPLGEDAGLPDIPYYEPFRTGLGAEVYSIGYSSDAEGELTTDILQRIATVPENMYFAESNLQEVYDKILNSIIYAANKAVVTDKMGEYFNLQIAPSYTTKNGLTTKTFDPEPYIEIGAWELNSDGTRNDYEAIETITFTVDTNGKLTAATSSLLSGNVFDAQQNKIVGKNVTYDFNTEEFTWDIGNITRKEITLKYYAYLEGSMEGEREKDLYDTNESAELNYNNYLGHTCHMDFPVPTLGWEEAAVSYEFYLVNELGQPVNKEGMVVPFSERVLVGNPQTEILHLNDSDDVAASITAKKVVPEGYILYNEDASYHIDVSSGSNTNSAVINDKAENVTTYYYDGSYTFNQDGEVEGVTDYSYTHVAFGVKLTLNILPDTVVIDYGIPVKIHITANDIFYKTTGVVTAISEQVTDGTVLNSEKYTTSRKDGVSAANGETLTLSHGRARIQDNNVIYEPFDMLMDTEEVFYYEFTTENGEMLYTSITVIPAANIYYEESFVQFVNNGDNCWYTAGSEYTDVFQAEDRPGDFSFATYDANNSYGRDQAYDDQYTTYSLGSAKWTKVSNDTLGKEPYATFSFYGTGFDFFSCTNGDTGTVLVDVMQNGKAVQKKVVNTYYGYSYGRVYLGEDGTVNSDGEGLPMYLMPTDETTEIETETGTGTAVVATASSSKVTKLPEDARKVDGKLAWTTPTYYEEDGETVTTENTGNPAYAIGWVVSDSENGLYQVPVIRIRELQYGKYDVKITPKYSKVFDMNYQEDAEENAYKIYVDAIRIYNPAGIAPDKDSTIGKAYIQDNEYIPQYIEVRKQMIDAETFYDSTKELDSDELTAGVVFIDGIASLTNDNIDDFDVSSSYLKAGPNNELYLAKGQAIAFHLKSGRNVIPESLQLGMKTVAGGTSKLLCTNAGKDTVTEVTVAGGSEQYRKLSSYVVWDEEALENGVYQTKYPIIIMNNSDGIAALTTLKWTYSTPEKADDNMPPLMMAVGPKTPVMAAKTLLRMNSSKIESVPVDTEDVTIEWIEGNPEEGGTGEVKVVTPEDVQEITIGDVTITENQTTGDGSKVWSYSFDVKAADDGEYNLVLKDNDGNESEVINLGPIDNEDSEEISEVNAEEAEEGNEEIDEEDYSGFLGFFKKLFKAIKDFFIKIMGWWK